MINASRKFGIDVVIKLCQRVIDEKGMPKDWKTVCWCQSIREKEM